MQSTAGVSLWRGGRARDHMVQQRFGCPRSSWSLAWAQDETRLSVPASPGGSSRLGPRACTSNTALEYDFDPPHPTPTSPNAQQRSLRSRRGRCSVCTSRGSPGSPLRHLFHRPHLHVPDLQDTGDGGRQPAVHGDSSGVAQQKATCT